MRTERLLQIIFKLLNNKTVTAQSIADYFGVSVRTIYRDIDVLSAANIPVYSTKGRGGGISLLDSFVIKRSLLSDKDQSNIIMALQSLSQTIPTIQSTLDKINCVFKNNNDEWLSVDFSNWGVHDNERYERFETLRNAILDKSVVQFDYFSSYSERTNRLVEPIKLVFKYGWYLQGYCKLKNDFRTFKISRMKSVSVVDATFESKTPPQINFDASFAPMREFTFQFPHSLAYRIFDMFSDQCVTSTEGGYTVNVSIPEDDYVYSLILSFGSNIDVIKPDDVRDKISKMVGEMAVQYKIMNNVK